jgi:hypothetical protein
LLNQANLLAAAKLLNKQDVRKRVSAVKYVLLNPVVHYGLIRLCAFTHSVWLDIVLDRKL